MINFSPSAMAEVRRLQSNNNSINCYVRIQIEKGGCSDYVYKLNFDNIRNKEDHQFLIHDDLNVIVDNPSYEYLRNLTIDYTEDLMGGAFQFKNPNIKNHCSCGLSFNL